MPASGRPTRWQRLAFAELGVGVTLVARVVLPFALFAYVMYWASAAGRTALRVDGGRG